jgi:hypothetical protein
VKIEGDRSQRPPAELVARGSPLKKGEESAVARSNIEFRTRNFEGRSTEKESNPYFIIRHSLFDILRFTFGFVADTKETAEPCQFSPAELVVYGNQLSHQTSEEATPISAYTPNLWWI